MKFALVNGKRHEAQRNLSGECPGCGEPVIAKCGEVRDHHWAHKGHHECDPWWENKTEWHRAWQNEFLDAWQEVVCHADGKWHIADVKTVGGCVIEFQHSYLKPEDRRARDAFYPKLAWVVDATRRERDKKQFFEAFNDGAWVVANPPVYIRQVRSDECALLREWAGTNAPVFFDFGNAEPLTWLFAGRVDGPAYVGPISRASFIAMHRRETETVRNFDELVKDFRGLIAQYELSLQAQARLPGSGPLPSFQRYHRRQARHRRRF